jgi:predicted nucleotidyltransferase
MSTIHKLTERGLAKPPRWLPGNTVFECIGGSISYGVSADSSDFDVWGITIPMKDDLFPHLKGEIPGFGHQHQRFEQYQEHHIKDNEALGGKGREYDITIYSIVKFFQLALDNNPNILDALFVPNECVLHCTQVGNIIRENRKLFLSKQAWPKFKGYAYSQAHKISNKNPVGKRIELVEKFGYDVKFAYHIVRLLSEVEQILTEGDLDLQRNREQLKTIRRGEWTEKELRQWFADKEASLEKVFLESTLRQKPDESAIKAVLLECLEAHYGNLSDCVVSVDAATTALRNIQKELDKVKTILGS